MATKKNRSKKAEAAATETETIREEIQAPYHFSDAEKLEMSRMQNEDLRAIGELEEQKKTSAQDFKLRIESAKNRVSQLQNKITAGYETRPTQAIVKFNEPKARLKTYFHPTTNEVIRTEEMTAADFQREMFVKEEISKPGAVAPDGGKKGKGKKAPAPEPGANAGQTSVGVALDKAAALKEQPKITFDVARSKEQYDSAGEVMKQVKALAKLAKWDKPATALLVDQLKAADTMEAMYAILEPHCTAPAADVPNSEGGESQE